MEEKSFIKRVKEIDIARELLINRYLLTSILANLYTIQEVNTYNFSKLKSLIEGKASKVKNKPRDNKLRTHNIVQFEKFAITDKQYKALIKEYGIEIVTEGAVILDGYLKHTGKNLKDNYKKLKQWAISLATKKRLNELRTSIVLSGTHFDYKTIEDKKQALQYIYSVPDYRRNIDEGVKYLVDRFELKGDNYVSKDNK